MSQQRFKAIHEPRQIVLVASRQMDEGSNQVLFFHWCSLSVTPGRNGLAAIQGGTCPIRARDGTKKALLATIGLLAFLTFNPESGLGESISVPLANGCPRSEVQAGSRLSAGLGSNQAETIVVDYGEGTTLSGWLSEGDRGVGGAWICVYSNVTTETEGALLGIAITDQDGRYEIAVPPGPSRTLTAVYKNDQGQIDAWALLQGRTAPVLRLQSSVVHNKHFAYFSGEIPGPDNDGVLVFLQVKDGKGWRVFRRYSTRGGGKFSMRYHFTRTFSPTTFIVRAQVLGAPDYPYLAGNSQERTLHVLP